ncbi:efflux RND transporter permease subunit [Vibrio chagasii]|nr:efflux RND transporter permease subunit [Vibrio chagasii]
MSVLNANNYQSATGQVNCEFVLYNGSADTQVSNVEELENLVVRSGEGEIIRLSDIAKVSLEKSHDVYPSPGKCERSGSGCSQQLTRVPSANPPINIAADVLELLPSVREEPTKQHLNERNV